MTSSDIKLDLKNQKYWVIESQEHGVGFSYLCAKESGTGVQWSRSIDSAIKLADRESAFALAELLGVEKYRVAFNDFDSLQKKAQVWDWEKDAAVEAKRTIYGTLPVPWRPSPMPGVVEQGVQA